MATEDDTQPRALIETIETVARGLALMEDTLDADEPDQPDQPDPPVALHKLHKPYALPREEAEQVTDWLGNKRRRQTRETYARALLNWLDHLRDTSGHTLNEATLRDAVAWRDALERKYRASTVVTNTRAVSALYGHLLALGLLGTPNPFARLDLPNAASTAKLKRAWRVEEIIAFMQAIPPLSQTRGSDAVQAARDRALFWLLFRNGLRVSEAIGARIGDYGLDLDGRPALSIREHGRDDQHVKRASYRDTALKPETADLLDTMLRLRFALEPEEPDAPLDIHAWVQWADFPLFAPARRGGRFFYRTTSREETHLQARAISPDSVQHLMRVYGQRAGLDPALLHPHAARRTAITHLILAGVPIGHVKVFSGHASLASVQAYFDEALALRDHAALKIPY